MELTDVRKIRVYGLKRYSSEKDIVGNYSQDADKETVWQVEKDMHF